MSFKPPYWYHDNIKFSDEEIDTLKKELTRMSAVLSEDDSLREQVTTYFVDDTTRPEKRFNNFYSKLVEDIMKNVGLYRMVRYEYIYWSQLYLKNNKHNKYRKKTFHFFTRNTLILFFFAIETRHLVNLLHDFARFHLVLF